MAVIALLVPFGLNTATATASQTVGFGMSADAVAAQVAAGVKPDYGTFWIGPWTLTSGWGGPDSQMTSMVNAGVTPAIHFYYWGDDISVNCIENGCWSTLHNAQKDRAHWQLLAQQLVDNLNATMGGRPALIFLETEFNKGSVATYEPLDGYLAAKANFIHAAYPQAKIVMALGNWNSAAWTTWDRTAAASDYTGIQGMRGSTRDSLASYLSLYQATVDGAKTLQTLFGKPIVIQDVALSSYPEPSYLATQRDSLQNFFTGLPALKAAGVQAILYRSWADNPTMDLANYYGEAERHWGLAWASNGTWKPAANVWVDGVKAERANASTVQPVAIGSAGGLLEAEAFAQKTTGGQQSDALASGGAVWNLWSNGYLQQSFSVASGDYDLIVRARGTTLDGVGPHMVVSIGTSTVIVADPGTSFGDFKARIAGGSLADLRITFTNDAKSIIEDRNLVLDKVSFTPAAPGPTTTSPAPTTTAPATSTTTSPAPTTTSPSPAPTTTSDPPKTKPGHGAKGGRLSFGFDILGVTVVLEWPVAGDATLCSPAPAPATPREAPAAPVASISVGAYEAAWAVPQSRLCVPATLVAA